MEKLENAKAGKGHEGGTGDESRLAQPPRPSGHSCSAAVVHLMISVIHLSVIRDTVMISTVSKAQVSAIFTTKKELYEFLVVEI